VELSEAPLSVGDTVYAVGHPFGLDFTFTKGIVSEPDRIQNGISYIQTDAAINPGNSGGPLVNEAGAVVGMNTFIIRDSHNLGFALPVRYLNQALAEYAPHKGKVAVRCLSCTNVVNESEADGGYCPHCGSKLTLPSDQEDVHPLGVSGTIEQVISKMGYDVRFTRRGSNSWEIERGSAHIRLNYDASDGYISVDAFLCKLPKDNIKPIYEYLLRQNNLLEGMSFSLYQDHIVLSLIVYDRYLKAETCAKLVNRLAESADHYDDLLKERRF
jgi:serine protease Do